jgi:hypothetical protein
MFSNDFTTCVKCSGFYVSFLDHCFSDLNSTNLNDFKVVQENADVKKYSTSLINLQNVKYVSYFGSLEANNANFLLESLPQISSNSSVVYKLKLNWKTTKNLNEIQVPSGVFLKYSGINHLYYLMPDVVTKPNEKNIELEMSFSFSPPDGIQNSNFMLSLPYETPGNEFTENLNIEIINISINFDDFIESNFDQGNQFQSIQTSSKDFFFVPYGLFHNRNNGKLMDTPGYCFYKPSNFKQSMIYICEENCTTCTRNGLCNTCSPGYYYNSVDRTCFKCSPECLTCTDHPEKCTKCRNSSISIDEGKLIL